VFTLAACFLVVTFWAGVTLWLLRAFSALLPSFDAGLLRYPSNCAGKSLWEACHSPPLMVCKHVWVCNCPHAHTWRFLKLIFMAHKLIVAALWLPTLETCSFKRDWMVRLSPGVCGFVFLGGIFRCALLA
jgi:hypothetical protein